MVGNENCPFGIAQSFVTFDLVKDRTWNSNVLGQLSGMTLSTGNKPSGSKSMTLSVVKR